MLAPNFPENMFRGKAPAPMLTEIVLRPGHKMRASFQTLSIGLSNSEAPNSIGLFALISEFLNNDEVAVVARAAS